MLRKPLLIARFSLGYPYINILFSYSEKGSIMFVSVNRTAHHCVTYKLTSSER